jgi:hypothetical protein
MKKLKYDQIHIVMVIVHSDLPNSALNSFLTL